VKQGGRLWEKGRGGELWGEAFLKGLANRYRRAGKFSSEVFEQFYLSQKTTWSLWKIIIKVGYHHPAEV